MLCLSLNELYSRWVPLITVDQTILGATVDWHLFDHIFPSIFMKWNTASMMNATMEKNPKALEERKIRHISILFELMGLYEHVP